MTALPAGLAFSAEDECSRLKREISQIRVPVRGDDRGQRSAGPPELLKPMMVLMQRFSSVVYGEEKKPAGGTRLKTGAAITGRIRYRAAA